MQTVKTIVELNDELAAEVARTGALIREGPDTVVRLAERFLLERQKCRGLNSGLLTVIFGA